MLQPSAYDRRRQVSSRLTLNMLIGLRQGGVAEGEARQKARQAGRRCKPHGLQSRDISTEHARDKAFSRHRRTGISCTSEYCLSDEQFIAVTMRHAISAGCCAMSACAPSALGAQAHVNAPVARSSHTASRTRSTPSAGGKQTCRHSYRWADRVSHRLQLVCHRVAVCRRPVAM
jgi:hypothetical protein